MYPWSVPISAIELPTVIMSATAVSLFDKFISQDNPLIYGFCLDDEAYEVPLLINWTGETNVEKVAQELRNLLNEAPRRQLGNLHPFGLQNRLWVYLLERAGLTSEKPCGELGSKGTNRLVHVLTSDNYAVAGKGAYRDEFVTCGGVSLESFYKIEVVRKWKYLLIEHKSTNILRYSYIPNLLMLLG